MLVKLIQFTIYLIVILLYVCIIHFQFSWLKQHEGLALIIKTLLRIKCQISKMSTDIQSLPYNSISSKSQFGELKLLIHTKTRKHTHSMFHCALIILFVSFRSINILHWSNMWDIFYWTIQSWSLSVLTELSLPNRKIIKCGIKVKPYSLCLIALIV